MTYRESYDEKHFHFLLPQFRLKKHGMFSDIFFSNLTFLLPYLAKFLLVFAQTAHTARSFFSLTFAWIFSHDWLSMLFISENFLRFELFCCFGIAAGCSSVLPHFALAFFIALLFFNAFSCRFSSLLLPALPCRTVPYFAHISVFK